ncbi:MAG: thioredoxin family protein [Deltaproteobacteria bacterium]
MEIKVLGTACANCEKTEKLVREAVQETGSDAQIVKVQDTMEIAKAGVFMTPAVIVDGAVKCVGKVPTKEEILAWIGK